MKAPKPIPSADPVRFATSDIDDAVWPVITSHPDKFVVNYVAADGSGVGSNPGRRFLAERSNGTRYHVGVDLFANHKDKVVACEDGKIVSFYGFYPSSHGEETYALFVAHEDFVVNYGEVKGDAQKEFGWKVGDQVKKGQEIARVSTTGMTHFETYLPGTKRNHRWMIGEARPSEVLNPTLYLLSLAAKAQGSAGPQVAAGSGVAAPALRSPRLAANAEIQLAAEGRRRAFVRDRDHGGALGLVQTALDQVLPPDERIDAGSSRGTFGLKTETAVKRFQHLVGLEPDGKIGQATLLKLDAMLLALDGSPGVLAGTALAGTAEGGLTEKIVQLAQESNAVKYKWLQRGHAPLAYVKGMALVYARVYDKFLRNVGAALEMARKDDGEESDVLAHYRSRFHELGMSNAQAGADALRHLFVLLVGLGMRESSGKHCEGMYGPDHNVASNTAEAGMFQTSFNTVDASPSLRTLFTEYRNKPSAGFLDVFRENVHCKAEDAIDHGSGEEGRVFQHLSKQCPAFAAEYAAIVVRKRRNHYAPIKKEHRDAEVRTEVDDLFKQVQAAVDASSSRDEVRV